MKTCFTIATLCLYSLITWSSFSNASEKDTDDGKNYARSRIVIDGEKEFEKSKRNPKTHHSPKLQGRQADFGARTSMDESVRSYIEDGNLSGIRGAFLMAYVAASIPNSSVDVMADYEEPLLKLVDRLGDEQFALCLSKMRPEVQSAVFYILFIHHWPSPDDDDSLFLKSHPATRALFKTVRHLKWPHDFEK